MRMPRPWALLVLLLSSVLLTSAGCGGPNLSKVEGVVTLDGAPLPGATVSFMPVGGGRAAAGMTDSAGHFQLSTFRTDDGALAGDYRVIVVVDDTETMPVTTNEEKKAARMTMTPMGKKKQAEQKSKKPRQVPEIYSDIKKTPLKEVVPTNGKIELALRSSMR